MAARLFGQTRHNLGEILRFVNLVLLPTLSITKRGSV